MINKRVWNRNWEQESWRHIRTNIEYHIEVQLQSHDVNGIRYGIQVQIDSQNLNQILSQIVENQHDQ